MALVDRNEPKDIYDIYCLLRDKKYSAQKLLGLAQKKFHVRYSEDIFWQQAMKLTSQMETLTPFLLGSNEEKSAEITKMLQFMAQSSRTYLAKNLL